MRLSREAGYVICLTALALSTAAYRHYTTPHPLDEGIFSQQPHVGAMYDWDDTPEWFPLTAGLFLKHPDVGTIVP